MFRNVPDHHCPLCCRSVQDHRAQIRRKTPELTQPVIGQRCRCNHQARPSGFPCGLHQCNHLYGFAKAHIVRQNPAHSHPVQCVHPFIPAPLVSAQAQAGRQRRNDNVLAALRNAFGHFLYAFVHRDRNPAVFQHTVQIPRPICPQFQHIPAGLAAVPLRRLINSGCQFLPFRQCAQIKEIAVFQPEIAPSAAQRLHQLQNFIQRLSVLLQHQLQFVAIHAHAAAECGSAGQNPFEFTAQENFADLLQFLHTVADKVKHRVASAQANVFLSNPEA